jgi:hypothetical protein
MSRRRRRRLTLGLGRIEAYCRKSKIVTCLLKEYYLDIASSGLLSWALWRLGGGFLALLLGPCRFLAAIGKCLFLHVAQATDPSKPVLDASCHTFSVVQPCTSSMSGVMFRIERWREHDSVQLQPQRMDRFLLTGQLYESPNKHHQQDRDLWSKSFQVP